MEQPKDQGKNGKGPPRLAFSSIGDIEALSDDDQWLVSDLISNQSLTVLAATPKTGKTFAVLELAIAVAAGTSVFGRFAAPEPGSVLIFPAEDNVRAIRGRIEALCKAKKLDISSLPIHVITAESLLLDDEESREELEELLEHLRPSLLILDPLVRLHSGAESYAGHIAKLFGYLRQIIRRFDLSMVVTHHVSKNRGASHQPGQSMRGSGDIAASFDHGWMMEKLKDGCIRLTIEQRCAEAPDPMRMRLRSTEGGGLYFEVLEELEEDDAEGPEEEEHPSRASQPRPRKTRPKPPLKDSVLGMLKASSTPLSQVYIRRALGVRNERLTQALRELQAEERIENLGRNTGWQLAKSKGADSSA